MVKGQLDSKWADAFGFEPAVKAGSNARPSNMIFRETFSLVLPGARLARLQLSGELKRSGRSRVAPSDDVVLFLVLQGCLAFDAGPTMCSGDLGILGHMSYLEGRAHEVELLLLMFDQKIASFELPNTNQFISLNGCEPAVDLLGAWIVALFDNLDDLDADETIAVLRAIANLAEKASQRSRSRKAAPLYTDAASLAKNFIERNIEDPKLSPDKISGATRLSRSRLFQLFATEGGIEAYVTRRRLDLCLRALSDLPTASRGVGRVAARYGFKSGAHFNRAFRKRFAAAPSAFFGVGAERYAEIVAQADARWSTTRPPLVTASDP